MSVAGEWDNFYVIIGSSAAALTGLQFVVIALSAEAERERIGGSTEIDVFATPTVVHFCAVLLIAAMIAIPRQTAATLAVCLTVEGLVGLLYTIFNALRVGRTMHYKPVLEDRIFHVILPLLAYATLVVSGLATFRHEIGALYVVAATALLLLLVGIHNAWDAAVYISTAHRGE